MDLESSGELLQRAKSGDQDALDRLMRRYVGPLRRWAHGRLPPWARDLSDTHDVVQDALLKSFRRLDSFNPIGPAALHSYLRQAVMNRIRDEVRRATRRPAPSALTEEVPDDESASPLERVIGKEALEAYESALAQLNEDDRELVIARIEFGFSCDEIATIFDKPTIGAARMAVRRALLRLAALMRGAI